MKKSLTKLIVSCAAVTAVAATMAISASAASYSEGKVTLATDKTIPTADGAQTTILVYKAESATDEASVTEGNIKYINQDTKEAIKAIVEDGIPVGTLTVPETGTDKYIIKIGGQDVTTITSDDFTLGEVTPPVTHGIKGDVTGEGQVTPTDATAIIQYTVNNKFTDKVTVDNADVTGEGQITPTDATAIIQYTVNNKFADKVGIPY